MPLRNLQPSQLYVSRAKLTKVQTQFDFSDPTSIPPIPVKDLDGLRVITDGHTRILGAYLAGITVAATIPDPDDLDWEAYRICVAWCRSEGITWIADLAARVVSPEDYERLWYDRCRVMQSDLALKRRQNQT